MLQPGESTIYSGIFGASAIGDYVQPGTGTAELLGVATSEFWFAGYASADHKQDSKDEALCESNHVDLGLKVLGSGDDVKPGMTYTFTADPDAGEGKRVKGAWVTWHAKKTNTGNCPIYTEWVEFERATDKTYGASSPNGKTTVEGIAGGKAVTLLNPGESITWTFEGRISDYRVKTGKFYAQWSSYYWYYDSDNNIASDKVSSNELCILLTYPDGDNGPHPGLSFTASWADDAGVGKRYEGAEVEYTYTFTNTGDCDVRMEFVASETVQSLTVSTGSTLSVPCEVELKPKDSVTMVIKRAVNQTWVDDGLVYIKGYRGGYYKDADGNEQIVKSNIAEVSIPLTYPDGDNGPHPGLTLTASWADDAGVGKRYEGAEVEYILTKTNTGDCPLTCYTEYGYIISIIGPSGPIAEGYYDVQPKESIIMTVRDVVTESHVESGIFNTGWKCGAHYIDADGQNKFIGSNKAAVSIPLTYPEGEEPEEAKPALEIKWDYDEIWPNGDWTIWTKTTEPGVIAPEDGVLADYTTINKGNVPLYVVTYATFGDGLTELSVRCLHKPGESESLDAYGSNPATEHLTPGTQTEDLLGTVTVSFYAVGYDPDQYVHIEKTGPELCHSETITRTWKVGKKTKWEIPEESQLTASLQVAPGYEHSDPAGYQLMEDYATVLYVKNTGGVDLDDFTVNDPWDGSVISGGPIKVDEVKSFPRASGTVTEKNVGDGSIVFPMITVTWTDPDSEENRPTYAGPLTLPVTSKTGLLVKKSVANKPAEGDYFKEDEVIKWGLTVTNNSKEPIKDVTVTDKGVTVGAYSEIAPGETKTCAVPDYTVTAYDADVVGYVLNSAAATGTDIKGVTRTYPSNTAKAWTSKPVTDIPTFDPEDHFTPDELPQGEDCCRLEPDAISENEAVYTLYTCVRHLEAAESAEMLASAGDWEAAAALWREEIDELYEALKAAADETGAAILDADREAFYAYADAVQALFGGEEAAELLRLRCCELCCMLNTAPEELPWSLTGDWAEYEAFETYEASSREIGYLSGSESRVTERYAGEAARALAETRKLLDASSSYVRDDVFAQGLNYWISALDDKVNPAYKAADKETRKLIAAWRKSLDSLYDAEEVFLKMLYPFDGETLNEQLMELYKAAALMEKSY